jgi:hypothetical protein
LPFDKLRANEKTYPFALSLSKGSFPQVEMDPSAYSQLPLEAAARRPPIRRSHLARSIRSQSPRRIVLRQAGACTLTNSFNPFPESVDSNPFYQAKAQAGANATQPLPNTWGHAAFAPGLRTPNRPFNPFPESVDSNPFNPLPEFDRQPPVVYNDRQTPHARGLR